MIKQSRRKLWQIAYDILPLKKARFWRKFGNPYTRKLIWWCDSCKIKIQCMRYMEGEQHLCEPCYKRMPFTKFYNIMLLERFLKINKI